MKKITNIFQVIALLLSLLFVVPSVSANPMNITDNHNGTITLVHNLSYNKRIKVIVYSPNDKRYQYELFDTTDSFVIPLTEGAGEYTIKLCQNIEGTRYRVLDKFTVTFENKDSLDPFLSPNYLVNYSDDSSAVKLASELTKDASSDKEKVEIIRNYIATNYSYDYNKVKSLPTNKDYMPDIEQTMKDKKGICIDIAQLTATMLRSVNIPAKVIEGYCKTSTAYHA